MPFNPQASYRGDFHTIDAGKSMASGLAQMGDELKRLKDEAKKRDEERKEKIATLKIMRGKDDTTPYGELGLSQIRGLYETAIMEESNRLNNAQARKIDHGIQQAQRQAQILQQVAQPPRPQGQGRPVRLNGDQNPQTGQPVQQQQAPDLMRYAEAMLQSGQMPPGALLQIAQQQQNAKPREKTTIEKLREELEITETGLRIEKLNRELEDKSNGVFTPEGATRIGTNMWYIPTSKGGGELFEKDKDGNFTKPRGNKNPTEFQQNLAALVDSGQITQQEAKKILHQWVISKAGVGGDDFDKDVETVLNFPNQ